MVGIEGEVQEREGEGMLTFRHTHIPEPPSHFLSSSQAIISREYLDSLLEMS